MKKIIGFALFLIMVLCSCSHASVDSSLDEGDESEIVQPDAKDEENKKDDDKQDEGTEDKVYDDDVEWGPLS
ncbi:MAG: hypothetical protein K2N64_01890 [Anaeroplasmataceae bacterium]|nr:hypothetical protein [Anaeroplasmataceae bacterium]